MVVICHVDSEILTNIQCRHDFMTTYCQAKSLLAALKVHKASPIIGTSENKESMRVSGDDKINSYTIANSALLTQ